MILSSKASFIHQRIRKNTVFAAFCAIFAAIYEHFSHQVYSPYMICAFLFPVCLGIVPDIIRLKLCKSPKYCIVESRDTLKANTYYCGDNGIKIVSENNERYASVASSSPSNTVVT